MQTFLPYADFTETARVLDMKRLGKQRVETLQVMKVLILGERGWHNHPAVKMWQGHEEFLALYQKAVCDEWTYRGYKDTCLSKTYDLLRPCVTSWSPPPWLGDEAFHASHRSNLLRKAPEHYRQFGWAEPDNLPYIWPKG